MGATGNNLDELKQITRMLKKEKEYGQGNILYIAGGICWILDLLIIYVRYTSETMASDIDAMPVIIAGTALIIVGTILMIIGKQKGNYQSAILSRKITYKEITNVTFENYSGVVYAKGLDNREESLTGEVCKACVDMIENTNYQKAYYVEINGKMTYKKVVLL